MIVISTMSFRDALFMAFMVVLFRGACIQHALINVVVMTNQFQSVYHVAMPSLWYLWL
jgi:hypothetical protein